MSLISLEVQLQKHMMSNDDSYRYPVKRTLLYSWLKEIRMITDLLEAHQYIHHPC